MILYRRLHGRSKKHEGYHAVQKLDGYHWVDVSTGEVHCNQWYTNLAPALLELGRTNDEPKLGINCTYYLYRDPWPERALADFRVAALENK